MEDEKKARQKELLANWYKNLSEEQREKRREQQREYRRRVRLFNKEAINAYKRDNRAQNRENVNERQRQYYAENRKKWDDYRARQDPEVVRRWNRETYRRQHKERLWRRFEGMLTRERFEELYPQVLNGPCDLCGMKPKPDRVLCLDHDHVTLQVRGVLCDRCNLAVERAERDRGYVQRFNDYVNRTKG